MDTISKRMDDLEERIENLEKQFAAPVVATRIKKISPKEFLMTKNAKSDPQKVVALAYFLEQVEGMATFSVADLENVFRASKEKVPSNINDSVNKNIAKGFLMDAAEKKDLKKAWCLTSTGERYAETELSKTHY